VSRLSCPEARCWIITKAKPVSTGKHSSSTLNASKPPAEAPIPTMGNSFENLLSVPVKPHPINVKVSCKYVTIPINSLLALN
jgi:hypothetical protein